MSWYERIVPSKWSPSRSVSSYFDHLDDDAYYSRPRSEHGQEYEFRSKMSKVLGELNRCANMIAGKNGDNHFSVKFAGASGHPSINGMDIDPSMLVESANKMVSGDDYYEAMDVLNGRVIIGAHIRNNADKDELNKFWANTDNSSKQLFSSVLEQESYLDVCGNWAGFIPYLEKHREHSHLSKDKVIGQLPNALLRSQEQQFINVISYNILNPDENMIMMEGELGEIIKDTMNRVGNTMASCEDAVNFLRSKLKNDVKKPPEKKESKDEEAKSKPIPSPEGVGDSALLAGHIEVKSSLQNLSSIIAHDSSSVSDVRWRVVEEAIGDRSISYGKKGYNKFVSANRNSIRQITASLKFSEVVLDLHSRGLTSGDLDENAFWKLRYDRRHIFEKKDAAKRADVVVGLLLDQSGSMRGETIEEAKQATIIIYEALKALDGVHPIVMGHTGQEDSMDEVTMIPYVVPEKDNSVALWTAKARVQNIDGEAIKHMGKRMQKVPCDGKRFLIVISDGSPAGLGYHGEAALMHTADNVKKLRKAGIQVFGVGIKNAFHDAVGNQLYGANNFVVLSDTLSSIKIMAVKLKQFFSKY